MSRNPSQTSPLVLPVIVLAQFFCTSLWFAGNAVIDDLIAAYQLPDWVLGYMTSAVQLGFITGTLTYAFGNLADRFSPSRVFLVSAVIAAGFNLSITLEDIGLNGILASRFLTGFFLAGIYPVGMKIAADHFEAGLGRSLGFLVGALVLGTAFPHLLKALGTDLPWKYVMIATSALATVGGLMMVFLVPNGPYRKANPKLDLKAGLKVFRNSKFRAAAFGYFGHMWELYAFWAFVPALWITYSQLHPEVEISVSLFSFFVIAIGSLACVIGGYASEKLGLKKVAVAALGFSGFCCLISPLVLLWAPLPVFLAYLLFWGMMVIADSPLFSTLVAKNAPAENRGTALTIVNSLGFAVTIFSIQLLSFLSEKMEAHYIYLFLLLGPVLGLLGVARKQAGIQGE